MTPLTPSADPGPFFHGTKADLPVGDLLTAGFQSNYRPEVRMNHSELVSLTIDPRVLEYTAHDFSTRSMETVTVTWSVSMSS